MSLSQLKTLCVVPARGGSKRVPRKNVRPINGVPMIARTLDAIIRSGVADRIVVSTDDDEIAAVSSNAGADVPFIRPAHLADDHTPTAPVVAHAIDALTEAGDEHYDLVLVVYPTAIFIRGEDLQAAKAELRSSDAPLVMSVGRCPAPIERAWRRGDDGRGRMLVPEHALTRTQDLPDAFYDAGQFYFGTADFWIQGGSIAGCQPVLLPLDRLRTLDVDTEEDLALAESLMAAIEAAGASESAS